jgi:hypothetical protein
MLSAAIVLLLASAGAAAVITLRRALRRRAADAGQGSATTAGPREIAPEPAHQEISPPTLPNETSEPQAQQVEAAACGERALPSGLVVTVPAAAVLKQHAPPEIFQPPALPLDDVETIEADTFSATVPLSAIEDQTLQHETPEPQTQHVKAAACGERALPSELVVTVPAAAVLKQHMPLEIFQPPALPLDDVETIEADTFSATVPLSAIEDQTLLSYSIEENAVPNAGPLYAAPPIPARLPPQRADECPADDQTGNAISEPGTPQLDSIHLAATPSLPLSSDAIDLTPTRTAVHRDRRGARRATARKTTPPPPPEEARPLRQAEAKLRLAVDHIRHYVALSLVLDRPEGFPDTVEIDFNGPQTTGAYDASRYDDIDLEWTPDLLAGELRISDTRQRLEWLRSSRDIHLFAPGELDLLSVSAARVGIEYAVVCRQQDAAGVVAAAEGAGSSPVTLVGAWRGLAAGWVILCGYTPARPIGSIADQRLSSLDPGSGTEIRLNGGLRIRANHFAEGHAPRIIVEPLAPNSRVLISGAPASQDDTRAWIGTAWDEPGSHLIDVVGGPSLTYSIDSDPGRERDWPIPDGSLAPFGMPPPVPAALVGAFVAPLEKKTLLAAEPSQSVLALGHRGGAQTLTPRSDAPAGVATLAFEPVFLVISSGLRRRQGRVLWLGTRPSRNANPARRPDMVWVSAVLGASARHLEVYPGEEDAKRAWRSAVAAARRMRRQKA